jgi:hypothetical protein
VFKREKEQARTDLLVGVLAGKTLLDAGHDDLGQLALAICRTGSYRCLLTFSLRRMLVKYHRKENRLHLRSHEGKLVVDTTLDNLGVDDEAGGNVVCILLDNTLA